MSGTEPLSLFVSRAPSAQALLDREMRYLACSRRWVADHGLDPEADYVGRSHYDVFPEIGAADRAAYRRCLAGEAERADLAPLWADGPVGARHHARPWHAAPGEVGGLALVAEDLADRDRRQRDALVAAVRNVEATLWAFDRRRRMTLHVGAPLETLGVGQGWNVGEDMARVYADLPQVVRAVERALGGEQASCAVSLDGRAFETVVNPMVDGGGEVCGGVGISLDVTDRVRAEGRAEGHAERLRRLLRAIAQEGTFHERAGAVLREVTAMLGLDTGVLAEIVGDRYTCRAAYADRGGAMAPGEALSLGDTYCELAVAAGDVVAIDHVAESDHRDRPCYALHGLEAYIGGPVYADGRPFGVLAFSAADPKRRPFTGDDEDLVRLASRWAGALVERDQHERDLRQNLARLAHARDQAEAASRSKSAFLASMSHEIRTPMNAVIGFGELLSTTGLSPLQRDYVETIRRSGERLLGLIDDVLDFSKIEAGRIELDEAPVEVASLVRGVLREAEPQAAAAGVELAFTPDPSTPARVMADEKRLQQILANLVSNAVKFTADGTVAVAVRPGAPPARLSAPEGSVWIDLEVRDTGIGIARDRLASVFEAFVQADESTTRAHGGVGLGLAITQRFVELMGGVIEVESEPGRGSLFRVRLPLQPAPAAGQEAGWVSVPGRGTPLAGARVLVVDDDPDGRAALVAQLRRWALDVVDTADPAEALARVRDGEPFDVALLDMQMPAMSGLELAEAIRAHRTTAELPIAILSSESRLRHAPDLVASTVLKPIAPVALYALLRRVLDYGRPAPPTVFEGGASDAGPPRPAAGALRVLLVEDEPDNRSLALQMLRQLGHRADVAADGVEALDRLRGQAYDVVLMDVMMPRLDGLEATRRLRRELPAGEQPHVVALTARALRSDREACLAAGMDGCLAKPVRLEALAEVLRPAAVR